LVARENPSRLQLYTSALIDHEFGARQEAFLNLPRNGFSRV